MHTVHRVTGKVTLQRRGGEIRSRNPRELFGHYYCTVLLQRGAVRNLNGGDLKGSACAFLGSWKDLDPIPNEKQGWG